MNYLPVIYTVAPALARTKAIPLPIPREAPVTMHTLPASEGSSDDAILICHNKKEDLIRV